MANASLTSMVDIFAAPNQVFDKIREKSISPWPAFFVVFVLAATVYGWYFLTADMYQYLEASMLAAGQVVNPEELNLMVQQESLIRYASAVTSPLTILFMYLILALLFFLAAMLVAEEKLRYGQFFTLVAWANMPTLLSLLSSGLSYGISDGFIWLGALDKTSLANLLSMDITAANYDVASTLTAAVIWSYVLMAMGFARITRCSAVTATIVGIIPPVIQFGLTYLL